MRAEDVITWLELKPHPEGGHFRETFRDERQHAGRSASKGIYFLFAAFEASLWHLIDAAVATHAANALGDVNRVIEVRIMRRVMNPVPFDRGVVLVTAADGLKQIGSLPDLLMAVHARLGRGDVRESRILDRCVAVAAIDSELTDMVRMTERNRLRRRLVFARRIRGTVECRARHSRRAC